MEEAERVPEASACLDDKELEICGKTEKLYQQKEDLKKWYT